jgi:hypothetical protein
MIAPIHPNPPIPRLDWCNRHGYEPCGCPAHLIVLGCMDMEMEAALALAPE